MTDLFAPLTLRGTTLPNRIGVSPMCQYCCGPDGRPTDWHLAHLLARAVGGAGMVMTEATAVSPEGRITPADLGLWEDAQLPGHRRLAHAIARAGAVPAMQIAHAGRKAARRAPWERGAADPGWEPLGPSAIPFGDYATPRAMDEADIARVVADTVATARRAVAAGYRLLELHAAHGYLFHAFLSPLSNTRNDAWGGDLAGRARLLLDTVRAVRGAVPADLPLAVRVSHTDWLEGGWTTDETVALVRMLVPLGVDLIDVSSGGNAPQAPIPVGPGYQVPGAEAVRAAGTGVTVAAVGLIEEPAQAQAILAEGRADVVLLARALLREPHWPLRAAVELGRTEALRTPPQYDRGWSMRGAVTLERALAEPFPALD